MRVLLLRSWGVVCCNSRDAGGAADTCGDAHPGGLGIAAAPTGAPAREVRRHTCAGPSATATLLTVAAEAEAHRAEAAAEGRTFASVV